MRESTPLMTTHKLNRTLRSMFRISECGIGIFDTIEKNGHIEFYWQINNTQSLYVTVTADIELIESYDNLTPDINVVTIKDLIKTEYTVAGARYSTGMIDLKLEDFIDALREGLKKTYSMKYQPFAGVTTIYEIKR